MKTINKFKDIIINFIVGAITLAIIYCILYFTGGVFLQISNAIREFIASGNGIVDTFIFCLAYFIYFSFIILVPSCLIYLAYLIGDVIVEAIKSK